MLNIAFRFQLNPDLNTRFLSRYPGIGGIEGERSTALGIRAVNSHQQSLHLPITEGRHERR